MISKRELKALLRDGLTGKEAARIVIMDSVEVDHGRPGILTQEELEQIKRSLDPKEAAVYNSWIYVYQLLGYSLLEAKVHYLLAVLRLEQSSHLRYAMQIQGLLKTAGLDQASEILITQREVDAQEKLPRWREEAKEHIKALKAYQQAIKELEALADVSLTEDFEPWWRVLEEYADWLNTTKALDQGIRLASLKPDPEKLAYMRDRIAMALGEDWYQREASHG